ncbi:mCG1050076, partial [Mus musculus]
MQVSTSDCSCHTTACSTMSGNVTWFQQSPEGMISWILDLWTAFNNDPCCLSRIQWPQEKYLNTHARLRLQNDGKKCHTVLYYAAHCALMLNRVHGAEVLQAVQRLHKSRLM